MKQPISAAHPHSETQAGSNSYAYDLNGNMISEYGYDGDGKRVWAKDYEGYPAGELKETIYIGNYYEFVREDEDAGQGEAPICESPDYCSYLPMIFQMPRGISYNYADGQKIALRDNDGMVSYLYSDHIDDHFRYEFH